MFVVSCFLENIFLDHSELCYVLNNLYPYLQSFWFYYFKHMTCSDHSSKSSCTNETQYFHPNAWAFPNWVACFGYSISFNQTQAIHAMAFHIIDFPQNPIAIVGKFKICKAYIVWYQACLWFFCLCCIRIVQTIYFNQGAVELLLSH